MGTVLLPQIPPPGGQLPLHHEKTLGLSQAAERCITQLLSQTWKANGNPASDRWESWSPVACQRCSADTFIRLFTLFWHPPPSARHQRQPARCTPHGGKESCVHTCRLRPPAQLCLSLLPPFITYFYVVVVNISPDFSC